MLISSGLDYSDNITYSYTYDVVGNITEIKKNGTTIRSFVYDELNQVTRENNHVLHCTENCPAPSARHNNILHKHQKRRFYQAALFLCPPKKKTAAFARLSVGEYKLIFVRSLVSHNSFIYCKCMGISHASYLIRD